MEMEETMRKKSIGLVAAAVLLCTSTAVTPALALEAKLSGQVNHLMMWADDGNEDDFLIGDNNNSSTRVRFKGEEKFGEVKAGVYIELDLARNATNKMTIDQDSDGTFSMENADRWLEAYFDTPYGKFQIGKGDGAANNVAEMDLSGTDVITKSDINATAGAFLWKNSDGSDYGATIGKTRDNFDGLSRVERVRYTTPNFGGVSLAASATNGGGWEGALFYAAEFSGNKLAAAIGYADAEDRAADPDSYANLGMSVSWLAPFGLNLTIAYGQRYYDDDSAKENATNYYAKLGYKTGMHAFSIEYGMTADLAADGDESSHYGVAYVVTPWKPVEFYAAYRHFMLDADAGDDPEDFSQIMAGTRIKF